MSDTTTPVRLNLKKDEKLVIEWKDGRTSTYSIGLLRTMCPCASCRVVREGNAAGSAAAATGDSQPKKKSLLTILPGNFAQPLTALKAELVGNYAIRIDWSDQHASGIYSFAYLREISL